MNSSDSSAQKFHSERLRRLQAARRIVIKLGTNVVAASDGSLSAERLEPLAAGVARLQQSGIQVVLVSSGAVGLGRGRLGLHRTRTDDLVTKQACAAVGQALLMHSYERLFQPHHVGIAQVLLTEDDFIERRRSSNLRRTVEKLLKLGVVPIVNENDTVSTAELESVRQGQNRIFSDNDRLAALVASKVDANALILLSNVAGLLRFSNSDPAFSNADPGGPYLPSVGKCGEAAGAPPGCPILSAAKGGDFGTTEPSLIPYVTAITPAIKALASGPSSGGRGGMTTKLEAAEIATCAGAIVIIADGTRPGILDSIFRGDPVGTVFFPAPSRMAGKRRWIAFAADVRGRVVVNAGAREALTRRKASLLWSGVVQVQRGFRPLDVISITDLEGREFARGIANQGSEELHLAAAAHANSSDGGPHLPSVGKCGMGMKDSTDKTSVLVTRDNIVLFDNGDDSARCDNDDSDHHEHNDSPDHNDNGNDDHFDDR